MSNAVAGHCCGCEKSTTIFEMQSMRLVVPRNPLAYGSLRIESKMDSKKWLASDHAQAYELMQKVILLWKQKGIAEDYMVYTSKDHDAAFGWEIVPFSKKGWFFLKQFKVMWHVIFGGLNLSFKGRQSILKSYQGDQKFFSEPLKRQVEKTKQIAKDAFCNSSVISKQLIFEGKKIAVLYDYRPIGKKNLHFLIVSKEHRSGFSDLEPEEDKEAAELVQKFCDYYQKKGLNRAYVYHKTGKNAGQSVPHWHTHLVFPASKAQELFAKIILLKNFIFGSKPLSEAELAKRVEQTKKELETVILAY